MSTCWKHKTAEWVCFWTERTIASSDKFSDDQRAYTTVTIPTTSDFTTHKSMQTTTGFTKNKYTEIWKCSSASTDYEVDAAKGTESNSFDGIIYQTGGNRVEKDK